MRSTLATLTALVSCATASVLPKDVSVSSSASSLMERASCANTATSRNCWGAYDINSNYYTTTPITSVTREYWLSVVNTTLAPDGYLRQVLTFNGTIPGPTIFADWGDELVIHVTNNLQDNGTSIHWHGVRQLGTPEMDGVPGVTQCPLAPGATQTYTFQATQYGTSWYHSHFSLQYADGLLGPLVINGPATANYDEDLGALFLQDWSHSSAFKRYALIGNGAPPALENGLINGTNAYTCPTTTDPNCLGNGTNFETTFVNGTKYRIRLVNTAIDGWIRFAIDDHNFTVIANDFVPITPFTTDNLVIGIGQRYDIIVDATAGSGDYWMRAIWQSCSANLNGQKILGIVRYNESSTTVPTTTEGSFSTSCGDVPSSSLVPALPLNPGNLTMHDTLTVTLNQSAGNWLIDDHSLFLNWSNPTTLRVYNNETIFPADYNVFPLAVADEWVYMIIQTTLGINHPIHLHGHDFMILAQGTGTYVDGTTALNLVNPTRRDVAWLPGSGYLVIGWQTDNPGSWLMHCHIAWHASEGLAVQFVERESEISATILNPTAYMEMCSAWETFAATMPDAQDDSGI